MTPPSDRLLGYHVRDNAQCRDLPFKKHQDPSSQRAFSTAASAKDPVQQLTRSIVFLGGSSYPSLRDISFKRLAHQTLVVVWSESVKAACMSLWDELHSSTKCSQPLGMSEEGESPMAIAPQQPTLPRSWGQCQWKGPLCLPLSRLALELK